MRILFVNHTAEVSGAELAMLELIQELQPEVECRLACPSGPLMDLARERGIAVERAPGTAGSLRLHPIHTPVAVTELIRLGFTARALARRFGADIVDAASIRAGLGCVIAARLRSPPIVVHVQDVLPPTVASKLTIGLLGRGSAALIASSKFTASGVAPWPAHAIPLPIDPSRFDPDTVDPAAARHRLGIPNDPATLCVIGQVTPWKRQDLAIRTLARLVESGTDALLLVVGVPTFTSPGTRFDNEAYQDALHALVAELGLTDRVRFLGQRSRVDEILAASDLLLMTSEGEPFGRVVVEAMAMGVPVVAIDEGGPSEIVRHEQEGLLVGGSDPGRWAADVGRLLESPPQLAAMGARGRVRATDYHVEKYTRAVLEVYDEILGRD